MEALNPNVRKTLKMKRNTRRQQHDVKTKKEAGWGMLSHTYSKVLLR